MDWPSVSQLGMASVIFAAYCVFGLTGFGSAMVAVPMLVHFVPLSSAVALIVLLDLTSTVALGVGQWRRVSGKELLRLMPFMAVGVAIGVGALTEAPPQLLLLALGIFVIGNSTWNLMARGARAPVSRAWAAPVGVVGGIFSGIFGTGGPLYVSYLARRLDDPAVLRATIAVIIFASAVVRLVAFGSVGIYGAELLLTYLLLLPVCGLGVWAGATLHRRVPAAQARQVLFVLLLLAGVGVIARAVSL